MMKNFKKIISFNLMLMLISIYASHVLAGSSSINQTFNYQGQLLDNGSPANGNYDITISGFFSSTGGTVQGLVSEHLNIPVSNGLFTLTDVDIVDPLGVNPLDGLELFLEVAVKPASAGSYTALSPRQSIKAVPYANNLSRNGATAGQVLTFNGDGQWQADTPNDSPWAVNGSDVSYDAGNVGIGTDTPTSTLDVQATSPTDSIFRVRNDAGQPRLEVYSNGGLEVGNLLGNPPARGLSVDGDVKQLGTSNGMLKYMVKATCDSGSQVVDSNFNGTAGSGAVMVSAFDIDAGACRLTFPSGLGNMTDLNNRYWVATAIGGSNLIVTCQRSASHALDCRRTIASSGSASGGQFMVLVY